jgi:hypothetical protein
MSDETVELQRVGLVARTALVLVVAGAAVGLPSPDDHATGRTWLSFFLLVAGVASAAWCLWHGARHFHERGRRPAAVAVGVGILAILLVGSVITGITPFTRGVY